MAEVDPRILQFDALSKEVLASTQRAARTVSATEKRAREADESVGRLQARAQGRGAGNLTTEAEAGEAATTSSRKRTAAYDEEAAALRNLTKSRAGAISQLELEAKAQAEQFRNIARQGPYAGGRANYNQYGAGGIGAIPPGATRPGPGAGAPGGRLALPAGPAPSTTVTSSFKAEDEYLTRASASAQKYTTNISRLAVEQNLASQAMRKNGALTTEFISAAKRGEVTVKELGYQTAATIGKFGGWLAAGSAVYGVFAAVQKLGTGALDAYSGVNELQRVINNVDPSTAKQAFSDLAGEFNEPIKTVTESVYQMGKVFHTQEGALAAARSVLYSVKVGELDVADSTRYLIAIVNGFHLPASKMAQTFDQINEAQNQFGITIGDVEAGLAKASGTWDAAGGSLSTLLSLTTAAQKATGLSGQAIGTAFQRAPNFIRKPENEQTLKEFGINPKANIDKVFEEAIAIAGTLTGEQVQALGKALIGPQLGAKVAVPTLLSGERFDEIQKKTSPQASRGSAERELKTQLGSVNEEVSRVGVSFERLGGELADSHVFDGLGGILKLLNLTLEEAIQVSEAFNGLPDGLKQGVIYAGQLALIIRGLRRLNLGETIEGGQQRTGLRGAAASAFGSGPIGEARQSRQALIFEKQSLEDKIASNTQRYSEAGKIAAANRDIIETEVQRAHQLKVTKDSIVADGAAWDETTKKIDSMNGELAVANDTQSRLAGQTKFYNDRLKEVDESLKKGAGRFGTLDTRATLEERERQAGRDYRATGFERPSAGVPVTGAGVTEAEAKKLGASTRAEVEGVKSVSSSLGLSETERVMRDAQVSTSRASQKVGRLAQLGGRVGAGFNGVINKLGTIFFLGGIFLTGYQLLDGLRKNLEKETEAIERYAKSGKQLRNIAKQGQAKSHSSIGTTISDFIHGSGGSHGPLEELFGWGGDRGEAQILEEAEQQKIAQAKDILSLQSKQRTSGGPVSYRYTDELLKEVQRIKKSGGSRKQKLAELSKVEEESENDYNANYLGSNAAATKKGHKAIEQAIEIAKAVEGTSKDFASALKKLTGTQLGEYEADYTAQVTDVNGGFNAFAAKRAREVYRERTRKLAQTSGPDASKELLEAQKEYYEALSGGIESELTLGLEKSRSPQQRATAEGRALHQAASQFQTQNASAKAARDKLRADQDRLQRLEDGVRERGATASELAYVLGGPKAAKGVSARIQTRLSSVKEEIAAQRETVKHQSKLIREQREAGEYLEEKLQQQIYEFNAAIRDAKFGYRASLTQDPLAQARIEIAKVAADLPGAIRAFGKESSQVYALLEQKAQALNSIVQQELSLIGARDTLAGAGINPNDSVGKAEAALKKLRDELSFEKGHSKNFDPAQVIELEAQIREAEVQLGQEIETEAVELRNAAFQKRINQDEANDHPVKAATEAIRQTKYDIAHAKTPVEKANLEATLVTQYHDRREAVAKSKLENIEFDASIDKITTTQEIAALERLLHDYKLSKDMRRSIREQIHGLKQDEGFDLNLGSITLPTAYDVRRAIAGGSVQNSPHVQVNNAPRITVNNYSSDDKVVGRALGRVLGSSTESAARSAGVA